MLNHDSNWSIARAKQEEKEDTDRYHKRTDFSRAIYRRPTETSPAKILVEDPEDEGHYFAYEITRQKETDEQGSWHNRHLGSAYTLRTMKAMAIDDVDQKVH